MMPTPDKTMAGVALLELALVASLLLLLLFGIVEFGRALTTFRMVVAQTEAAARLLATRPAGSGRQEALCLVRSGVASNAADCGGAALLTGMERATVEVSDALGRPAMQRVRTSPDSSDAVGVRVNLVQVSVSGVSHRFISPLAFANALFGLPVDNTTGGITLPTISSTLRQVLP